MGVDCCYDDDDAAAADVVEPFGNTDWAGRRYYANLIRGFRLAFNYIRTVLDMWIIARPLNNA